MEAEGNTKFLTSMPNSAWVAVSLSGSGSSTSVRLISSVRSRQFNSFRRIISSNLLVGLQGYQFLRQTKSKCSGSAAVLKG
jgi:hypothetical protein